MLRAVICAYSACNFITILSLSTIHRYTMQTSALVKPLSLVCFCPHWAIPLPLSVDVLYG